MCILFTVMVEICSITITKLTTTAIIIIIIIIIFNIYCYYKDSRQTTNLHDVPWATSHHGPGRWNVRCWLPRQRCRQLKWPAYKQYHRLHSTCHYCKYINAKYIIRFSLQFRQHVIIIHIIISYITDLQCATYIEKHRPVAHHNDNIRYVKIHKCTRLTWI